MNKQVINMSNTSWQSKRKYNKSVYDRLHIELDKELVADWKEALKRDNLTQAGFVRKAILKYLEQRKDGGVE